MKKNKLLWWVIGIGLGLRLLLWLFQVAPQGDDGNRYLSESINLVRYGVFSTESYFVPHGVPAPSAHDMPLWPGIMAVVYWLTDSIRVTQYIAGLINLIFCFGSALLFASLLRSKPFSFSGKSVAVALGVYLFLPDAILYSLFHMPEQTSVFFVILALWCYFRGVNVSRGYLLGAAVSFALAIYSKPICLPLAGALILALLLLMKDRLWQRCGMVLLMLVVMGGCLSPWFVRNKMVFGTAGLTSISGTNLYYYNWREMVLTMPQAERAAAWADIQAFEATLGDDDDLMLRSKKMGAFAQKQILDHLPQYALFSLKRHPRMYLGTGTVALFRYLGMEQAASCLDGLFGAKDASSATLGQKEDYTSGEKAFCLGVQIVLWLVLLGSYILVLAGAVRGVVNIVHHADDRWESSLILLCPILCLLLLAAVIGPIATTRYRFVMIPFFAMLAAYSVHERQE